MALNLESHAKSCSCCEPISLKQESCCDHGHDHDHGQGHDHGHDHGHTHSKKEDSTKRKMIRRVVFGVGIIAFLIALLAPLSEPFPLVIFLTAYLCIGGNVLLGAAYNITRGQIFDENFLMAIASIGAFCIGEYPEGVAVMLFYQIGEAFQEMATGRARKSIASLMDIRPEYANIKRGDTIEKVAPEAVEVGDFILVKPGEKIPLDGIVESGYAALDTSALTGESMPRDVGEGDSVLSGSINTNGLLTIQVTKVFGESTVSKILELVQNASERKAPAETFITKFARYYTPAVVFLAVALAIVPPLLFAAETFSEWIGRALVFLVVSCPCALVISIPLSFFGGIGAASRKGILVKGGNYLEALYRAQVVVFDKTGTLTKGKFRVSAIVPGEGFSAEEILEAAAFAECYSNHPIALSIMDAYGKDIPENSSPQYEEVSGRGVRVSAYGRTLLVGSSRFLREEQIEHQAVEGGGTVVYVAIDGRFGGYIRIEDEIKPDSIQAIKDLKAIGIEKTVMLTGDNKGVAGEVAGQLGIDEVHAELLPNQKVDAIEQLEAALPEKKTLIFVGDGLNDAPVLARADIGIAMGGVGTEAAIEAADIVLMTDEPSKIAEAIRLARKTQTVVRQNIIFALAVKGVILLLGAAGIATMWEAVFGDVGVALIAICNAMRIK
ncbi:MAG: cadmium-translocating P-type ATPase [Clostridiales Family XIII bacterium]|nr:cadmium-translocating P-type ATPase [Clostridiales Family XIII bacterium]